MTPDKLYFYKRHFDGKRWVQPKDTAYYCKESGIAGFRLPDSRRTLLFHGTIDGLQTFLDTRKRPPMDFSNRNDVRGSGR